MILTILFVFPVIVKQESVLAAKIARLNLLQIRGPEKIML